MNNRSCFCGDKAVCGSGEYKKDYLDYGYQCHSRTYSPVAKLVLRALWYRVIAGKFIYWLMFWGEDSSDWMEADDRQLGLCSGSDFGLEEGNEIVIRCLRSRSFIFWDCDRRPATVNSVRKHIDNYCYLTISECRENKGIGYFRVALMYVYWLLVFKPFSKILSVIGWIYVARLRMAELFSEMVADTEERYSKGILARYEDRILAHLTREALNDKNRFRFKRVVIMYLRIRIGLMSIYESVRRWVTGM